MHNIFLCTLFFILLTIESGIAQKTKTVSFASGSVTIKEGISQIEKQTGYSIAYEQSGLNLSQVVSLSLKEGDINQALQQLLNDTQYTFKIKGYHIILFIDSEKRKSKMMSKQKQLSFEKIVTKNQEDYTFTGEVVDSISQEALAYSTISLLDKQGNKQAVGITDDKGLFKIKTSQMPSRLVISFVGYSTFSMNIKGNGSVGTIQLSPSVQALKGAIITANFIEHKVDRDVYFVTEKMREKASNAEELLDQIHGVRFDKLTNSIMVGTETAVLLLVDGIQQSAVYIKNLPPNRISKIEVITEPGGRYVSDGYSAIINFILQKDYVGYDINTRNSSMVSLGNNNAGNWLINDQPGIGITYTKNKINTFANYSFAHIQMNTPVWKKQIFSDLLEMYPIKAEVGNANNRYKYKANYVGGGISYQLTPSHSISFQGDYTYQNTEERNRLKYNVLHIKNDIWSQVSTFREDATRDKDYVATVFYKGELLQRLKIYSDFTYNYYSNNVTNEFEHGQYDYSTNAYNESKNYIKFNLEGEYIFSPKLSLNLGYANVWRKYKSENDDNFLYLYYNEWRNQIFNYLQYKVSNILTIKAGVNVEYIRTYSETKNNDWSMLPYFQLNYKANKNVNLNVSYQTNSYYPTLFQLSPLTTVLDSLTRQSGNPELKSAVRHTISAKLTLWNRFTIKPMVKFTPKRISEVYSKGIWDNTLFSSFKNINSKQYVIQATYDQSLGCYFNLSNTLTYYYNKASYQETSNSYNGWMFDSEVGYFNPKWNFGAQIGYYRNIDKSAMLQGYQMINLDSWQITINKQFWQKQASLMITYFPPLSWGVRDELDKEINTPFYTEKQTQSLKPYRDMLMVKFNLRFNSGNVKSLIKQSSTEKEERAKRAVNF
nr:TonB-dependent receptor [uncultured Macellibacteroides sp.]